MGITLNEIVFDIGGGTSTGLKFKAIQTGGLLVAAFLLAWVIHL